MTDDWRRDPPAAAVSHGRALLADVGIPNATPALAALAHAAFVAASEVDLPAVRIADELAWAHTERHGASLAPAPALDLCEATPVLAARLPSDPRLRADAARFEIDEALDAITRRVLFNRVGE